MAARLADVEGFKRSENTVQCLDPNGMTIRFEQSFVKEVPELKTEGINQYGNIQRVNAASPVYEKGQPVAIGHVVFFTPDLATTENFYIEKVGFHLSDAWFGQIIPGGKTLPLLVGQPTQQGIPLQPRQTATNGYTVLTLISGLLSKISSIKKPRNRRGFLFNKLKRLIPFFFKLIPKHKGSHKGQNG